MSAPWPQRKQELICVKYSSEEVYFGRRKTKAGKGISVRIQFKVTIMNWILALNNDFLNVYLNLSQTGQRPCAEARRGNVYVLVCVCGETRAGSGCWKAHLCETVTCSTRVGMAELQTTERGVYDGCHHRFSVRLRVSRTFLSSHTWIILQSG